MAVKAGMDENTYLGCLKNFKDLENAIKQWSLRPNDGLFSRIGDSEFAMRRRLMPSA